MENISYTSVEILPGVEGKVAFTDRCASVFREDTDVAPVQICEGLQYMPWGSDNRMPYDVLDLIEKDETLSTCQMFNAEICYGNGLRYNTDSASSEVKADVDDFLLANDLSSYFLGVCQDFKHFGFCVSVIILDKEGKHIVGLHRKEACYCRFAPANKDGIIETILYGNWNKGVCSKDDVEVIPLLNIASPWNDLATKFRIPKTAGPASRKCPTRKFAVVTRVPTPDSTYYPIPYYASLFRGRWYNIKQLIALAKESKLKNSAPIKYQIEISNKYWDGIFKREHITDRVKMQERIKQEKETIINFLTGAESTQAED